MHARARARSSASGSSTHPLVRKVCFTGSTEVGKRIMAGCADQVKRVTLELGGKSANIVFADADLERGGRDARRTRVFDNAGQDCCARSRILVQRSAYDEFLGLLEPAVDGDAGRSTPADDDSEMGPLISARPARHACAAYVDERRRRVPRRGARRRRLLVPADRGAAPTSTRRAGSGARRSSGRSSR